MRVRWDTIYRKQCEVRQQLTLEAYNLIYAGEMPENREVRWKWVTTGIIHLRRDNETAVKALEEALELLEGFALDRGDQSCAECGRKPHANDCKILRLTNTLKHLKGSDEH